MFFCLFVSLIYVSRQFWCFDSETDRTKITLKNKEFVKMVKESSTYLKEDCWWSCSLGKSKHWTRTTINYFSGLQHLFFPFQFLQSAMQMLNEKWGRTRLVLENYFGLVIRKSVFNCKLILTTLFTTILQTYWKLDCHPS